MTDMAPDRHIPPLTLGWRLKMSILGKITTQAMADSLEVSRATVSRWMADKGAPPRTVFIKQWALMTGTDVRWLLTGEPSPPSSPAAPLESGPAGGNTRWNARSGRKRALRLVAPRRQLVPVRTAA